VIGFVTCVYAVAAHSVSRSQVEHAAVPVVDGLRRQPALARIDVLEQQAGVGRVLVLDQAGLEGLPLPLSNPERIVLITHRDTQPMAEAWEAGIVSVVSAQDPMSTVLLAIMAAGLRVEKRYNPQSASGISPTSLSANASLPPESRSSGSKRAKHNRLA